MDQPNASSHHHNGTFHGGSEAHPDEERVRREAEEEEKALQRILSAFRAYETKLGWEVARWQHNYGRLPDQHKALLPDEPTKYAQALECIQANQLVINSMLEAFDEDRGVPRLQRGPAAQGGPDFREVSAVSNADIDKVKYVFKNLMRDWSVEGAGERSQSYGRMLAELRARLPLRRDTAGGVTSGPAPPAAGGEAAASPAGADRASPPPQQQRQQGLSAGWPHVLVPGAGLGRLCLEVAAEGYDSEGCEHSWFMLIASAFILNKASCAEEFTVHPFVHSSNNQPSTAAQLRGINVPDVAAAELPLRPGSMSMCAGDFLEVYGGANSAGQYDAVLTCFFLDTAHNVLEYIEVLYRILKPGGYWINLGPLLWHWSDSHLYMSSDELSVEVSLEDVLRIASAAGFATLQRQSVRTAYTSNVRSMMHTVYDSAFWTMQKPLESN